MDQVPVIFKKTRSGEFKGEVHAFFPTLEARPGFIMCYAHVGQHSEASLDFYRACVPANGTAWALFEELRGIYETGPDAVKLVERKRISRR